MAMTHDRESAADFLSSIKLKNEIYREARNYKCGGISSVKL